MAKTPPLTRGMLDLIDASPTPFHAVAEVARRLDQAGFSRLEEADAWKVTKGDRHYVVRSGSSLMAFVVGQDPPAEAGFRLVGAHTDSPGLRLKPRPAYVKEGYRQLGLEVYGGALLYTWLDRDLGLAGRVWLEGEAGPRLLRVDRPLCRVPSLAIHLNREVNESGLVLNKQEHLPAVMGLEGETADPAWFPAFLGRELGVEPGAILDFDLMLFDLAPGCVSGMDGEFVTGSRIDNLACCHAGLEALLSVTGAPVPTAGLVLYDHEEVGSTSAEGAGSTLLSSVLERLSWGRQKGVEDHHRALARSLFVSADMAHAVHPNYADKHEPRHQPRLGGGPVVKVNHNLRYATSGATASAFERAARAVGVPLQRFVIRTDLPCGSTIGPLTAARTGIPTVDVGNPMLSMHSIREMASSRDQESLVRVLGRVLAER